MTDVFDIEMGDQPATWTTTSTPFGIFIEGSVPIDMVVTLSKGYEVMVPGIAYHYGATMALATSKESADQWTQQIEVFLLKQWPTNAAMRWINGVKVGSSSRYLFSLLAKRDPAIAYAFENRRRRPGDTDVSYPRDGADLWRVFNMIDEVGVTADAVRALGDEKYRQLAAFVDPTKGAEGIAAFRSQNANALNQIAGDIFGR